MRADKQVSKAIILAQSDNLVSNNLLKKNGRQIMSMDEDSDNDDINNWIVTENRHMKLAETVKKLYHEALDKGYIFEHDAFGGYGLFYNFDVPVVVSKRRNVLLNNLCALLQPVTESDIPFFQLISIFPGNETCRQNRIMVGLVRFPNISWFPYADYAASSLKN